jgi:hypothetical protein
VQSVESGKINYEHPLMAITLLDSRDVITTSGESDNLTSDGWT